MRKVLWTGGALGLASLAIVIAVLWVQRPPRPADESQAARLEAQAAATGLDLMRVEPIGTVVMSGHAEPDDRVSVRAADGAALGEASADSHGEWLLALRDPLAAGTHALSLTEILPDGRSIETGIVAIVNVPAPRGPKPLVINMTPGRAPVVLQSPDGPGASAGLLEAAEFSPQGALTLGGRGDPGTQVYIYLDDNFIGEAVADSQGRWIRPGGGNRISPGDHKIRIDMLAVGGEVAARGEVVFARQGASGRPQLAVMETAQLWRVLRPLADGGVQELIVFRPGAIAAGDPDVALPGQMISPQTIPVQHNPL